jgi:hypothetical protein
MTHGGDRPRSVAEVPEAGLDRLAPPGTARRAALAGVVAGAVGVVVMTAGEQAEQAVTHRPDSYVPARTLQRLLGRRRTSDDLVLNHVMHYGQGALVGAVRGLMAHAGWRGPGASLAFTGVRLTVDQVLENGTGVGAPPWTWPRDELVVDVLHKLVYAFATGAVADRLVPRPQR